MTNKALIRRLQISCLGLDPIDPLRLLVDDVIEALREHAMYEVQRLGQEIEQEPVAWADHGVVNWIADKQFNHASLLYTHPPQRTWVGLTDEEQQQAYEQWQNEGWGVFYRAIEAKLKELNT